MFVVDDPVPSTYSRLDRPAPGFALIDQRGSQIEFDRFRGRPVLVTLAYAHCETVCRVVVRDVLATRRRLAATQPVVALVVTLDPWRDVRTGDITHPRLSYVVGRGGVIAYAVNGGPAANCRVSWSDLSRCRVARTNPSR